MDVYQKNKVLIISTTLLVIINIISIGSFWFGLFRPPIPPPPPEAGGHGKMPTIEIFRHELRLDAAQSELFEKSVRQHFESTQRILDEVQQLKKSAFENIGKDGDSTAAVAQLERANSLLINLDKITYRHFSELRTICTPQQRGRFDELLTQVLMRMPPPGAPDRHAHP